MTDHDLKQTAKSFKDKWENNSKLAFNETLKEGSDIFDWILNRNGFDTAEELKNYLSTKQNILDAGCGNGRVTALLHKYSSPDSKLTAIDLTAAHIASENLSDLDRVSVFSKDLLGDLSDLGQFDFIYCQEVLHHTENPKKAFLNLCGKLSDDGEIAIYVYKKKAAIREFADDYVRDKISGLSYEDSMIAMTQITNLGKSLHELNMKIKVDSVDVLGIESGEYDVQRFLYHFFLKCFWNPQLTYQENVAINYDWYHPILCTRHTLSEIQEWFKEADLTIVHHCVDPYGITVRGKK